MLFIKENVVSLTLKKLSKLNNQLTLDLAKATLTICANEYLVSAEQLYGNYITITIAQNNNKVDVIISSESLASIGQKFCNLKFTQHKLSSSQVYIIVDLLIDHLNQHLQTNLSLRKIHFGQLKMQNYAEIKMIYLNSEHSIYLNSVAIDDFNTLTHHYFDYMQDSKQSKVIDSSTRFSFAVTLANTHLSIDDINHAQSGDIILLEDYAIDATTNSKVMIEIGNESYLSAEIEDNQAIIKNIYTKPH